jgi:hypothetical protein
MGEPKPPLLRSHSLQLHVGRNSRGYWVVRERRGRCGGLFVDRAEALRFAMFECGCRPQAVIMVPGVLELDLNAEPDRTAHEAAGSAAVRRRAA